MSGKKVLYLALALGGAIAVIPAVAPAGPDAGIDASSFLATGRFAVALGAIFLGGLLTSLTPCVYPLIPITVSVFGARKAESRGKAVLLTSAYVAGMGAVFSVLGVGAALSGKVLGSALGSPWVVAALAVFLIVLAISMFGAFDLTLPSGLATRLNNVGGGGLVGALLMGGVSGFLAAPCTGPVLTGVLAFVAKSQNPALGGALLFTYALGIGVPFFLIGVFTVRLPKGGAWMEWVKSFFGIALVALALAYLRDAFPGLKALVAAGAAELGRAVGIALAALLVFGGVMLGAIHRSFKQGAREVLFKAAGVGVVVLAVLLRLGASGAPPVGKLAVRMGLVQPAPHADVTWDLLFPERAQLIATTDAFDAALARARAGGKPVMVDFFADWCEACKELDREVYPAPAVIEESRRFVNIKVDATNEEDAISQLFGRYGIQGLPTVVFIDGKGRLLKNPRVTGFLPAERFVLEQRKVLEGKGKSLDRCSNDEDCPHGQSCKNAVACRTAECPRQCG